MVFAVCTGVRTERDGIGDRQRQRSDRAGVDVRVPMREAAIGRPGALQV